MRVAVAGGRRTNIGYYHVFADFMDRLNKEQEIKKIVHGGAIGVDNFADRYASERNICCVTYLAKWRVNGTYNNGAGYARNNRMMTETRPDLLVAMLGGNGTNNTIALANKMGVKALIVEESDEWKSMIDSDIVNISMEPDSVCKSVYPIRPLCEYRIVSVKYSNNTVTRYIASKCLGGNCLGVVNLLMLREDNSAYTVVGSRKTHNPRILEALVLFGLLPDRTDELKVFQKVQDKPANMQLPLFDNL